MRAHVCVFVWSEVDFRQDSLEAILVIFGQRALIFFFEISWKNMKNDTTFVRMEDVEVERELGLLAL